MSSAQQASLEEQRAEAAAACPPGRGTGGGGCLGRAESGAASRSRGGKPRGMVPGPWGQPARVRSEVGDEPPPEVPRPGGRSPTLFVYVAPYLMLMTLIEIDLTLLLLEMRSKGSTHLVTTKKSLR